MNIKQTLLKTSAFLALCAISTMSSATLMSIGDMASFNFKSMDYLSDYSTGAGEMSVIRDKQTLTLDRFDASLGQLLDVNIWFESDWTLMSIVKSYDTRFRASASGAGRAVSRQVVRMTDPNHDTERNREVVRSNCRDFLNCTDVSVDRGAFNDTFDLSGFSLSDFIGTNQLEFSVVRTLISDLTRCGPYDSCSHRNKYNSWSGNIYVSYLYNDDPDSEVNVPEPSTLVLLGMGLLGIGATRLGRKRND